MMMRSIALLLLFAGCAPALATPCDEVKAKIAAKLDAKGVVGYTIEAVPMEQDDPRKQVGVCEGGAKKLVYSRG